MSAAEGLRFVTAFDINDRSDLSDTVEERSQRIEDRFLSVPEAEVLEC